MNWLEIFQGILISPPFISTETDMGGLPLEELHIAPSDSRASSNGCMGRILRLESPVKTNLSFD